MAKLMNLKQWLTLPEAAEHLSTVLQEKVNENDLLRLALDGHLTLSCNLVNGARVRLGTVVRLDEAEMGKFPAEMAAAFPGVPEDLQGKPLRYVAAIRLDDDRYLNLGEKVTTAWGVWDVPMLAGDKLDIEHLYQSGTGGPAVTVTNLEGAFLANTAKPGELAQLQESFDENEYSAGSTANLARIKQRIASEGTGADEARALLAKHAEDRRKFLESRSKQPHAERYYPAAGLPDAPLVIRTREVVRFQQEVLNGADPEGVAGGERDEMGLKERTTLLAIIGLVAHAGDLDLDELPRSVLCAAEDKGVSVSRRTVEEKIKGVRAAMADRTK